MLLEAHPVKAAIAAAVALLLSASAFAQPSPEPNLTPLPNPVLVNVPQKQLDDARALGEAVVRDMLEAYENRKSPEFEQQGNRARTKFDAIADETMAADRGKVLEFLGIDPQADSGLYFFLSWSMPLEVLRSYAIEAMWSGGTLVFKGVPPGKELAQFLTNDVRQLVYGKGAAANISLDPRLFDAYAVTSVPSIVFTTVKADMQCQGIGKVNVKVEDGREASYDTCPKLDDASFWKITGAVTTSYALQAFIDDGAAAAQPYLKALSKGWAGTTAPGKDQKPFTGNWSDALSPSEKMEVKDAADALMVRPSR